MSVWFCNWLLKFRFELVCQCARVCMSGVKLVVCLTSVPADEVNGWTDDVFMEGDWGVGPGE